MNASGARTRLQELRDMQQEAGFLASDCIRLFEPAVSFSASPCVVVCHGLNMRPSAMDPLASALAQCGFPVLRMALADHCADGLKTSSEPARAWSSDVNEASSIARALSPFPPRFVGYSLGAATMLSYSQPFAFSRMVLLAPALAFHGFFELVGLLSPWPGLVIPSASPQRVRARRGTPVREYIALRDAADSFWRNRWSELKAVPTLVVMSAHDEMVSFAKLRQRLLKERGHAWRIAELSQSSSEVARHSPRHLIVDRESLGTSQFDLVVEQMVAHFR